MGRPPLVTPSVVPVRTICSTCSRTHPDALGSQIISQRHALINVPGPSRFRD
jgi:hypothetical protein